MEKLLSSIIQDFVWRYKSIPFVIILGIITILPQIPKKNEVADTNYFVWLFCVTSLVILYIIFTYQKSKLPSAKGGKAGVLFIISAETNDQYNHVVHCLAKEFEHLIKRLPNNNIEVVCISKEQIKDTDLADVEQMTSLLTKTKCWFNVNTKYSTDDVKQSENFEMSINYGMLHPRLAPQGKEIIQKELDQFAMGLCKQHFKKEGLLQTFNATALTLSYICEYFLGISIILDREIPKALNVFIDIADSINGTELTQNQFFKKLLEAVGKKIHETSIFLQKAELDKFKSTRDKKHLRRYREIIEKANIYLPETYGYYLDSAMLAVLIDGNALLSSKYVNKCREIGDRNDWKYSDAFLAAYENKNPLTVYRKYQAAFKSDFNILMIIEFIECLLDEEPQRGSLHLSLLLCYRELGDYVLMHRHIARYENWHAYEKQDDGIHAIINSYKRLYPCPNSVGCGKLCAEC